MKKEIVQILRENFNLQNHGGFKIIFQYPERRLNLQNLRERMSFHIISIYFSNDVKYIERKKKNSGISL